MEEVKIVYCYDEKKNPVHYLKTVKTEKYYCIDCGQELICKEGNIKIKHLAHKNTSRCRGTGESIFHKHWKENLFKAGMFINIANRLQEPNNVEILEVVNEVSINKRYNTNWDNEIIVDVLLITEKGDIVVEINYKNPKDWDKLKPFYDELDLLRVYEVKVDKNVNTRLEWFCLGEDEEIEEILLQERIKRLKTHQDKQKLKEEKKKEKARLKKEAEKAKEKETQEMLKLGVFKKYKILFNYKTPLIDLLDWNDENLTLECLAEVGNSFYKQINLYFNLENIKFTKSKLYKKFRVTRGIKFAYVIVNDTPSEDGYYEVINLISDGEEPYNNRLYAQLCNLK